MKIGDRVIVNNSNELFAGCEGFIIDTNPDDLDEYDVFLVDLYKGNDRITEEEINEHVIYFNISEIDLL